MKPFGLLLCLILIPSLLPASGDPPAGGARAAALGGAFTAARGDVWSLFYNPAALSSLTGPSAGFAYERRFALSSLNYASAAFAMPFAGNQGAGLSLSSYGFSGYIESRAGLGYGITVLKIISIGASLNYFQVAVPDYGSASGLMADAGLLVKVNEQIHVGFNGRNMNRAQIRTLQGQEELPTVFNAGLSYQPTDKVMVLADVQKDVDHPVSFRGGIEYSPAEVLSIRAGVSTEPLSLTGGVGVKWKVLRFDLASSYTSRLGYSPYFSLTGLIGKS